MRNLVKAFAQTSGAMKQTTRAMEELFKKCVSLKSIDIPYETPLAFTDAVQEGLIEGLIVVFDDPTAVQVMGTLYEEQLMTSLGHGWTLTPGSVVMHVTAGATHSWQPVIEDTFTYPVKHLRLPTPEELEAYNKIPTV